jgi:hypothetical protein
VSLPSSPLSAPVADLEPFFDEFALPNSDPPAPPHLKPSVLANPSGFTSLELDAIEEKLAVEDTRVRFAKSPPLLLVERADVVVEDTRLRLVKSPPPLLVVLVAGPDDVVVEDTRLRLEKSPSPLLVVAGAEAVVEGTRLRLEKSPPPLLVTGTDAVVEGTRLRLEKRPPPLLVTGTDAVVEGTRLRLLKNPPLPFDVLNARFAVLVVNVAAFGLL